MILLSSLIAVSNAFSLDRLNKKHRNRNLDIERNSINAKRWQLVPVLISVATLTLGYPGSASAISNNASNQVLEVVAANLADTDAFKKLPLEKTYSGAIKEIRDQQDLQGMCKVDYILCYYVHMICFSLSHTNFQILVTILHLDT